MKVLINVCYGGFNISSLGKHRYRELSGEDFDYNVGRSDPYLIQVVEELGEKSFGDFSDLKIVEVPDEVDWVIEEYDGREWVAEVHRTWS